MNKQLLKIKRIVGIVFGLAIVLAALIILHRHTEAITWPMMVGAVQAIPAEQITLSISATLLSFAAMAVGEIIAVKTLPDKKLPSRVPILAGAVGNALSNTLGFHALTISAWRYRVYSSMGLNLLDIARITAIAFVTVVLGFAGVAGFALLLDTNTPVGELNGCLLGAFLLLLITGFLVWISRKPRRIGFKNWTISLPDAKLGSLQFIVGFIDISAAIYASYALIPPGIASGFPHFSIFYIAAVLVGIASHAPGGIGVFEAGMMTALAANGRADVLAALLLYRVIYNLMPFGFACVAVAHTLRKRPQLDSG